MKLVKIFDEYNDIIIRGKSNFSKYDAYYKVEKKPGSKVELKDLQEYVNNLRLKYPGKHFLLKKVKINNKVLYVITKKSYYKTRKGKIKIVKDRVPIYVDLDNQEFFVPESYIKYNRKLTNYIIMRTLGSLGVSRVKYLSMAGRVV